MRPETEEIVDAIFERLGKELARISRTIVTMLLVATALVIGWRAQPSGFLESVVYVLLILGLVSPLLLVLFEKLPRTWRSWVGWPLFFLWCYVAGDAVNPRELRPFALLAVASLGLVAVLLLWGARHLWQVSNRQRVWLGEQTNLLDKELQKTASRVAPTLKRLTLAAVIGVLLPLIVTRGDITESPSGDARTGTLLESLIMWGAFPNNFHKTQIALLIGSMFLVAIVAFVVLARGKSLWTRKGQDS